MIASTRRRRTFLYLFVVAAFLTLAARVESQDRQIENFLDHQCQERRANVQSTIDLRRELVKVSDVAEANVYANRRLILPDCR